eukprot:4720985-Prymnesium_polylepis.2
MAPRPHSTPPLQAATQRPPTLSSPALALRDSAHLVDVAAAAADRRALRACRGPRERRGGPAPHV